MKVKKFFSIITILTVVLTLGLTGCIKQADKDQIGDGTKVEETTDTKTSTDNQATLDQKVKNDKTDNTSDEDWRQFLKEYELWMDEYISFMKKYTKNPTDASLIADYAKFMSKISEWGEKSKNIENSLKDASPDVLGEYYETLSRIIEKMNTLNE